MTMIHPARPATTTTPIAPRTKVPGGEPTRSTSAPSVEDLAARVAREGRSAGLDDVLRAVAVNALAPDSRLAVARDEWAGIEDAIRGPVQAAADAALDRLAADLAAALPPQLSEVLRRLGDHRLRAELGYD